MLYVSPLKALAVDVERNLRTPLAGLTRIAERLGLPAPHISVGVRSGDTPPARRRQLITQPPDVLITTPESLFLMLTSAARETLAGVQTVIVDEIHAIAGTKRGAHLALSLERLDDAVGAGPAAQRIGLSATVRPPEELARFLSGQARTTIVAPPSAKTVDLSVQVPVPDMANLANNTIWPDVEARLVDLIEAHNSTIVFANSRRLAERLTARLNEIHAERSGIELAERRPTRRCPAGRRRTSWPAARPSARRPAAGPRPPRLGQQGAAGRGRRGPQERTAQGGGRHVEPGARHRHGRGRSGDPGRGAAVGGQRPATHRAGRTPGRRDLARRAVPQASHRPDRLRGDACSGCWPAQIETMRVPANPLDILAQHTVAAAALEPLDADRWFDTVRRSAPFATLPRSVFEATLDLLSGKYPSTEFAELRPRLVYDRDTGMLTARPGAQRLAVTSGGAIPDRGLFTVYLATGATPKSLRG